MFKFVKSKELAFCLVEGTKKYIVLDENKCFILCFPTQSTTKYNSLLASLASQAYTQENKNHRFMLSVALEKPKGKFCLTDKKRKQRGKNSYFKISNWIKVTGNK